MGGQNSGIFSPEEQAFMRDAVLKHSYPFELNRPLDFSEDNKQQAIANLISIVDAMGVTANTKCPALYREVLSKADLERLAQSDGPEVKRELQAIIDQALKDGRISPEVAEGYRMALDYDASTVGAKMILPQFGGKLEGTRMERAGDGDIHHFALHLDFGVSSEIRDLAAVVGDKDAVKAFTKMVDDLTFQPTAEELEAARAAQAKDPKVKIPTVTDLGARAKVAQNGTPQELTTGGAVKITLTKLQE
jgi:hypothetical protein